jgi:DNA-binding Lrp family transcriptional regulator
VGILDPVLAGLSCAAFVRVRLRDHSIESVGVFRTAIGQMQEVTLCVMITGETDYLLKVVAADLPQFQEVIQTKLLRCPAVLHVESSIVLEYLKDTTELPIAT